MTLIIKYALACAILLSTFSCYKDNDILNTPGVNGVYITQATSGNVFKVNMLISETNKPAKVPFSVSYAGSSTLKEDIEVEIAFDSTLLYKRLSPESQLISLNSKNVKLNKTKFTIKAGSKTSEIDSISINFTSDLLTNKPYYLPIKINVIDNKSNVKKSYNQDVIYYLFEITPSQFEKKDWKIVDFSSEEDVAEGPKNGLARFAIDNDNSTFWITLWKAAQPNVPHWITVDMAKEKDMIGIVLNVRDNTWNSGKPKDAIVYTSLDGKSWDEGEAFNNIPNMSTDQYFPFSKPKTARYFRFKVNTTHENKYWVFINEIGAY